MVSRVIQELSALIFHRQPMPVGTNVDPVHQDILEMAPSVWVSLQYWQVNLRMKEVPFPLRTEAFKNEKEVPKMILDTLLAKQTEHFDFRQKKYPKTKPWNFLSIRNFYSAVEHFEVATNLLVSFISDFKERQSTLREAAVKLFKDIASL